jgi:peptidoglycan hydrolase-like protein with peptidoglycan-binding domain
MVHSMRPFPMLVCGAIFASGLSLSAVAQTTSPLAYVQPVSPGAVQTVQERLRAAGAYNGAVDGVWGQDSIAGLQQFQSSHQLQVTGQLNQATAQSLGIDLGTLLGAPQVAAAAPIPSPETLRPASVRTIQARLHTLGFYAGGVDGVWGQSTLIAVKQFQQGRGLPPTGQLNPATLSAMGVPSDTLAYR